MGWLARIWRFLPATSRRKRARKSRQPRRTKSWQRWRASRPRSSAARRGAIGAASAGALTAANLTDKLNNALASIQAGLDKQAINQLNAFISSVQSSVKTGKMSIPAGNTLINDAEAIIAAL
jgi:hypothetical protein